MLLSTFALFSIGFRMGRISKYSSQSYIMKRKEMFIKNFSKPILDLQNLPQNPGSSPKVSGIRGIGRVGDDDDSEVNDYNDNDSGSTVYIQNNVKSLKIDSTLLTEEIEALKEILGVSKFQVDVTICSELRIRRLNLEWRKKRKSTDILSFPANDFTSPEIFADDPTLEFQKHLGDIFVSPSYVQRQCIRDQVDFQNGELDEDEDAGISRALSTNFNLTARIHLLMIHGVLHLLGYDHETQSDWEIMTAKEDEMLNELKKRYPSLYKKCFTNP